MDALEGKALIAQSGGPTGVINASLIAAADEAKKHPQITGIYASLNGLEGALKQDLIDLTAETGDTLEAVALTSGSAVGSTRMKPKEDDCMTIFSVLRAHCIRYFFYIGGNDSADTARIVNQASNIAGYDLRVFHIPKTIDNDLRENDHTPGYGSAARYVALEFMGFTNDQLSLPGIHLVQVMGRHSGILTAASVLGKNSDADAPHFVYIPEVPFSVGRFVEEVLATYDRLGMCVVAFSEGIKNEEGKEILTVAAEELYGKAEILPKDKHGNIQLSGLGVTGDYLLCKIVEARRNARVRTDRLTYNQRSHPAIVSEVDRREAGIVAREAVIQAVMSNTDGSIAIVRAGYGPRYGITTKVVTLESVAKETKPMPSEFYNPVTRMPTPEFAAYARDLIGILPEQGRFARHKVEPINLN